MTSISCRNWAVMSSCCIRDGCCAKARWSKSAPTRKSPPSTSGGRNDRPHEPAQRVRRLWQGAGAVGRGLRPEGRGRDHGAGPQRRGQDDADPHHHGPVAGVGGPRSEEHTSELQSLMRISYAVFCLKKKTNNTDDTKH